MTTFRRYLLFQLPGWAAAALVLAWLGPLVDLSLPMAVAAWAVWALKDLALYPFVASAYEPQPATGAQRLVGLAAVVCARLDPCGQVRMQGEIWQACTLDAEPVPVGTRVVVVRSEGLTLHVAPVRDEPASTPRAGEIEGERGRRL